MRRIVEQLGQAEFQADGEHQEHHAEFGQIARSSFRLSGIQSERVRPDRHADQQIAEHRRQLQAARNSTTTSTALASRISTSSSELLIAMPRLS